MTALAQPFNIGAAVWKFAQLEPDREALIAADIRLTYANLWQLSRAFAVRLQENNVSQGSRVCVLSRDAIASVATMLATTLLGAKFEILSESSRSGHSDSIIVYTPDQTPPNYGNAVEVLPEWSPKFARIKEGIEHHFTGYQNENDPWWTLYTSGTTGAPKALELTHRMAFDRSIAVSADFRAEATRFTSLFPCNTRPFFVRAMAALVNGSTIVDTFDSRFMAEERVNLVAGANKQVQDWLAANPDAHRFPVLQVSGSKVSKAAATHYLERFDRVEDVYGSGETNKSFVTAYSASTNGLMTVGKPQDSIVQIVDEQGKVCGPGQIGQVRIKNDYMTKGYRGAPEATKQCFRNGWFYPGDLARWGSDMSLDVVGRVDHVLNLGGAKIDPLEIESVLMEVSGVQKAVAIALPIAGTLPRLLALLQLDKADNPPETIQAATKLCSERLGGLKTPQLSLVVPEIPVTIDGTPRRHQCLVLAKALIANMPTSQQETKW